jgi:hypothetical protein
MTYSQQPGIKYASAKLVPICAVGVFFFYIFSPQVFLQLFLWAYNLGKHQTVYNTWGRNELIYEQMCIQICIYDSLIIGKFGSLLSFGKIGCYTRFVVHPVTEIMIHN